MNSNIEEFKLSTQMKENLSRLGYSKLTSIQEKVIPVALEGRDVIGQSKTGTGKTAAFLIPIIELLEANQGTQALILAPTRELALQIKEEALKLSTRTNISVLAVYGGESINNQIYHLKKKAEIVVGTPGRIIDHLKRRTLNLGNLKFFVLDEVDEMLKRGFIDDIKDIAQQAKNEKLQTLFFSATISRETRELADSFLRNPVFISNLQKDDFVKPLITQHYLSISNPRSRISNLIDIIHFQNPELAIIFASTKKMVDVIADELTIEGFTVEKIHSDLSQQKRTSVYNSFKNKKVRFLVATDIAARGIDVEGISHVYNYDFPQDSEFYIHRIGRTGRAGLSGQSIILLNDWELRRQLPFIERLTGENLRQIYRPSFKEIAEIIEEKALEKISTKIKEAEENEFSAKSSEILKNYNSEQILKGFISTLVTKRKRGAETIERREKLSYENAAPGSRNRSFDRRREGGRGWNNGFQRNFRQNFERSNYRRDRRRNDF